MIRNLFLIFIFALFVAACDGSEREYTDAELTQITEIQEISDQVQTGINALHTELSKSNNKKEIEKNLEQYTEALNNVADLMNNQAPDKQDFLDAAEIYSKVINIYKNNGFDTKSLENKIEKFKSSANKLSEQ